MGSAGTGDHSMCGSGGPTSMTLMFEATIQNEITYAPDYLPYHIMWVISTGDNSEGAIQVDNDEGIYLSKARPADDAGAYLSVCSVDDQNAHQSFGSCGAKKNVITKKKAGTDDQTADWNRMKWVIEASGTRDCTSCPSDVVSTCHDLTVVASSTDGSSSDSSAASGSSSDGSSSGSSDTAASTPSVASSADAENTVELTASGFGSNHSLDGTYYEMHTSDFAGKSYNTPIALPWKSADGNWLIYRDTDAAKWKIVEMSKMDDVLGTSNKEGVAETGCDVKSGNCGGAEEWLVDGVGNPNAQTAHPAAAPAATSSDGDAVLR
jgi:hypothetical protein